MKSTKTLIAIAILIISVIPVSLKAGVVNDLPTDPKTTVEIRAKKLNDRLEEINAMDKSEMKGPEKKALRKEVRAAKKELKEMNGGVYLSVGAIIIIVLLLIILV